MNAWSVSAEIKLGRAGGARVSVAFDLFAADHALPNLFRNGRKFVVVSV